ncbi:MAG: helix-turn-helix domain-containing protein [Tepidisphaeraceae bacterium]|jgi:putative transcriptional regulator
MPQTPDFENLSVFQQIKYGLRDAIAHSHGQLNLRTTTLPAPPPPVSPRRVLALRRKLNMSQTVFAATLNVSPKLVQSWEQGSRKPIRGDLRLIEIIEREPRLVGAMFADSRLRSTRPAVRKKPARRLSASLASR